MIAKTLSQPIEATTATGFADDQRTSGMGERRSGDHEKAWPSKEKVQTHLLPAIKRQEQRRLRLLLKMLAHKGK